MIRTIAPKLLGGRLCLNCALTTPELPANFVSLAHHFPAPLPVAVSCVTYHVSSSPCPRSPLSCCPESPSCHGTRMRCACPGRSWRPWSCRRPLREVLVSSILLHTFMPSSIGVSVPIAMRLVLGFVFRLPRWYERCLPLFKSSY